MDVWCPSWVCSLNAGCFSDYFLIKQCSKQHKYQKTNYFYIIHCFVFEIFSTELKLLWLSCSVSEALFTSLGFFKRCHSTGNILHLILERIAKSFQRSLSECFVQRKKKNKKTAGLSGIETPRLLKATYILCQPIHGSICGEKRKKKRGKRIHALVCFRFPVERRTWLHYTVWDLFKNASWRSGKAFKHDIRPHKSLLLLLLLDVAAHSNTAAEGWRKHWRNAHQHRARALSWGHTLIQHLACFVCPSLLHPLWV